MKEPVAYAAMADDGSEAVYVASLKEQAEAACQEYGWTLVPLYACPYPTFTKTEKHCLREARDILADRADSANGVACSQIAAVLDQLLRRLE